MRAPYRTVISLFGCLLLSVLLSVPLAAQEAPPEAPDRTDEGEGPYERLVLRGATLIDGTGAPPVGPVDIVIENDRITDIVSVGYPGVPIDEDGRPDGGDHEIDLGGHYVLPGFVDMHAHLGGTAQGTPAEYVLKLWMGHGVTTVREPGSFNGIDWTLAHRERSASNEIVAPRLVAYVGFGQGHDGPISTPEQARAWVQDIAEQGAEGIKFFGARPSIMEAALDEAQQHDLGTAMHHAQLNVTRVDALQSATWGLTTMEHWYGLPEALFTDRTVQDYPTDYNYNNEMDRFREAGRLWKQAAEPGSARWNAVMDSLIALDFTLNPTLNIYEASRDLMRARNADWHEAYTLPSLQEFFTPSRVDHGSYFFDWTTTDEIEWKRNYDRWMTFLDEYKNRGGRVTTGSDSGYIYQVYGFGFIRELELLQEAGFHPLEVITAASLSGAEALGMEAEIGSVEVGKKADLVVVDENPLHNLKVLYGTGALRLNDETDTVERVGGVSYTVKDGILYDAERLRADVRAIVEAAKAEAE
ncbi:amidohydrolase family protein [Longimonas sp.]|uniref:amidohydrolase family protein n=1 Tax=Longimonas sp. TaxID=2039626 RepID=UPI0033656A69